MMSRHTQLATGRAVVIVEIEDDEGNPTGRAVPVDVTYAVERYNYGADADGRRGEMRQDITVLDTDVDPAMLRIVNPTIAELCAVLDAAKRKVEEGKGW